MRITGFGLEAILEGNEIVIFDDSAEAYRGEATPRIKNQFKSRQRPGQKADAKMTTILECLSDEPALENYL